MLLFGISEPTPTPLGRRRRRYGMHGLGGLGDGCSIDTDCLGGQTCNADSGMCEDFGSGDSGSSDGGWSLPDATVAATAKPASSSSSSSSGTPWWQSAITAISTGATAALKPGAAPAAAKIPVTPWYQSPIGIGAIALGVVGLVVLLKQ